MEIKPETLQQYLLEKKVDLFDSKAITVDEIKDDKVLCKKIGAFLSDNNDAFRMIISARMRALVQTLTFDATAYEVLPIREAIKQLAMLIDDVDSYTTAADNLRKAEEAEAAANKDKPNTAAGEPVPGEGEQSIEDKTLSEASSA